MTCDELREARIRLGLNLTDMAALLQTPYRTYQDRMPTSWVLRLGPLRFCQRGWPNNNQGPRILHAETGGKHHDKTTTS